MKRKSLAAVLFAIANLAATPVLADNALKLKPGYGWVVIAVDDGVPATIQFGLRIIRFDPILKRGVQFFGWTSLSTEASLTEMVDAATGRRFLIGQMKETDAAIMELDTQGYWGTCFDKQTQYFHVAAGQFNLVGSIDPRPSIGHIQAAVTAGKMPAMASKSAYVPPLMGESLEGFTRAADSPSLKTEADAYFSGTFSQPVSSIEPTLNASDYATAKNIFGQPSCFAFVKKSEYPEK